MLRLWLSTCPRPHRCWPGPDPTSAGKSSPWSSDQYSLQFSSLGKDGGVVMRRRMWGHSWKSLVWLKQASHQPWWGQRAVSWKKNDQTWMIKSKILSQFNEPPLFNVILIYYILYSYIRWELSSIHDNASLGKYWEDKAKGWGWTECRTWGRQLSISDEVKSG